MHDSRLLYLLNQFIQAYLLFNFPFSHCQRVTWPEVPHDRIMWTAPDMERSTRNSVNQTNKNKINIKKTTVLWKHNLEKEFAKIRP